MRDENQVWYSMARTINTGNYESLKFEIGESRAVDEDDDSEEVYKEIRKDVNTRMAVIIKKLQDNTDGQ